MKSRQESKLSMYLAAKDFLATNATVVTPLPNYSGHAASFLEAIAQIQNFGEQQRFDKSGLKVGKVQLMNALIMLTADSSRKMQAFARYANNQLLLSETKYSESILKHATDNELRDIAQGVYNRAQCNITALEAYGISAGTQTILLNTINAYVESIPKPRVGKSETKQFTQLLANAFQTADTALENMDVIVEIVKLSQPNFYNGYKSVRKLISTGRSTLAVKGVVTDLSSGEPLKNVRLSFSRDDNGIPAKAASKGGALLVKKTAGKGGFIIKTLPAGSYHVTCSKGGYVEQTLKLAVTDGELSVLNMQLSKN